jgi:hypothetical protein
LQINDLSLKRKLLIDGEEIPGLVETSELNDEEGTVEVPSFNRKIAVKDGVKTFSPLDCVYKISRDTKTQKFFSDWYFLNQYHDITVINTDGTGSEIDRWLLRDCECKKYSERTYNAGAVEFYGIAVSLTATTTPVHILT